MTHTHHKWDCPKSNGRHEWEWDWDKIITQDKDGCYGIYSIGMSTEIGLPVKCKYDCGAFGIEWYRFEELIYGE